MTLIEDLNQFLTQLQGFEPDLILVTYDRANNTLTFRQREKTAICSCINYLYLPIKRKYHILAPDYYQLLLNQISELIMKLQTKVYDELMPCPKKGETDIWVRGGDIQGFYPGPKLVAKLRYFNISNPIAVRFWLYFYSRESRVLYNYIKNESRSN